MRPTSFSNAMNLLSIDSSAYISIDEFMTLNYREIMDKSSTEVLDYSRRFFLALFTRQISKNLLIL